MSILDNFLIRAGVDVVGIFDQNFTQIFKNARPIKAVVKEEAKVMEHPLETGAVITDHRIILPIEIELSLILKAVDYEDTYYNIKQFYLNANLLIVQTRSSTYINQLISSMPHEEDPSQYDTLVLALTLKQAQFVTPQYSIKPAQKKDNTTVDRGVQQPKEIPEKRGSVLEEKFGGYFK